MTAGRRPALGLIVAGAFSLLVSALLLMLNECAAIWAQPGTYAFLGALVASGIGLIWAGLDGRPDARVLAHLPAGIVAGLLFGPSTGALVAIIVAGLALGAAPRSRFGQALALLAGAVAAGLVLTTAVSGSASC